MGKHYLFNPKTKMWNKLLHQFRNLYHSIKISSNTKQQQMYQKLKKMQQAIGIKFAGTAILIIMLSVTSFAQEFTSSGDLQAIITDIGLGFNATPVFADIDGDGDMDLYVGNEDGYIQAFTNDGSGNFTADGNLQANGTDINVGIYASPEFADIDGDNDLDLYVGNYDGNIKVFKNNGSGNFTADGNLQAGGGDIDVTNNSTPEFADIDGDGDLDLYVGNDDGYVKVFTNVGSGSFTADGNLQSGSNSIDVGDYSSPEFADIDKDGDLDLYVGERYGKILQMTAVILRQTVICRQTEQILMQDI